MVSQLGILKELWSKISLLNCAVAVWRLPHQNTVHFLVDFSNVVQYRLLDIKKLKQGFLIAPFNFPISSAFMLRPDIYFSIAENGYRYQGKYAVDFLLKENNLQDCITTKKFPTLQNIDINTNRQSKQHFFNIVEESLKKINQKHFNKVVIARRHCIHLPQSFNEIKQFAAVSKRYPASFASLISIPKYGKWLGASPETLIRITPSLLETVSLAGTQNKTDCTQQSPLWSPKEREEQAIVTQYITKTLNGAGAKKIIVEPAETVDAGNILHLKTTCKINLRHANPDFISNVLNTLHPTPAICGNPKKPALEFINQYENFNRKLYSGFLGPVNLNKKTHLFVNIRCMNILQSCGLLYAGVGITKFSIIENEWRETELKFKTLLDTMNNKFSF